MSGNTTIIIVNSLQNEITIHVSLTGRVNH
jgi:hypothetical protein